MSNPPTAAKISSLVSPVKSHGDPNPHPRSTSSSSAKKITTVETSNSAKWYNAVKADHPVRRAATFGAQSPPLSERDSIFAEHYTTSQHDSGALPSMEAACAPLPGVPSNMANLQDSSMKSALLPSAVTTVQNKDISFGNPLGSAELRTSPVGSKTFSIARPVYNTRRVNSDLLSRPQAAYAQLRTSGMHEQENSSINQNQERQTTPVSAASDVAVEDDLDHKTTIDRGSSMKQALRHARTERSASRGRVRVEKSIEVSIANAEPVKNARSRKSSHYMGLFQDDPPAARTDTQQQRRQVDDGRGREISASNSRPTSPEAKETGLDYTSARASTTSPSRMSEDLATKQHNLDIVHPVEESSLPSKSPAKSGLSSKQSSMPTSPLRPDHDPYFRRQDEIKRSARTTRPLLPAKLLQEIREPHTLLPITSPDDHENQGNDIDPTHPGASKATGSSVVDLNHEDGEEHISSIIYKPPPGRPVEEAEELVSTGQLSQALQEELEEPQDQEERHVSEPKRSGSHIISSEHIDISIKSKHEERVFHGNYQIPDDEDETDVNSHGLATIDELPTVDASSASESEFESGDDYGIASQTDDGEITPTATPGPRSSQRPRAKSTAGLRGAVELQPYKNQVGGHSQILAFSPRAIAKELNNRENEFYEKIEYRHPELLSFLPKYLGVVNVNFAKGPKPLNGARSVMTKDTTAATEQGKHQKRRGSALLNSTNGAESDALDHVLKAPSQPKAFSHSPHAGEVPQLILDQNRHFLPASLLGLPERPRSADPHHGRRASAELGPHVLDQSVFPASAEGSRSPSRPPLPEHSNSWGTTSVNETLREQVLREVLRAPRVQHHKRHAASHSTLPRLRDPAGRRKSNLSVEVFGENRRDASDSAALHQHRHGSQNGDIDVQETPRDLYSSSASVFEDMTHISRVRTTSTASSNGSAHSGKPAIRRRHSGMGLRRRPTSVNGRDRGNLEYFDDESYGADEEDEVFAMENEKEGAIDRENPQSQLREPQQTRPGEEGRATLAEKFEHQMAENSISETNMHYEKLPTNPKDARTSALGGRVELYIVLEDLNAGMGKPCALDLKMGTRQYGVEAKRSKMLSQRQKCRDTTSQQLGVRFCGMNFYDIKRKQWGIEDKYAGRDIKAGREFREALIRFLYDGVSYDSVARHIPTILDKLSKLESLIRRLPGYRFYGSSLLLLYDAEPQNSAKAKEAAAQHAANEAKKGSNERKQPFKFEPAPIRVKMLDFTNCVTAEDGLPPNATFAPEHLKDVDRGYLRGLRTLRIYFKRILRDIREQDVRRRGSCDDTLTENEGHEKNGNGDSHDEIVYDDDGQVST